ncbi:hypothetical protein ELG67_11075 [Rhizobium leguminosarum]|uniref:hypothetical protein n=1 Tax=Rhizobium leguminosarum TaxID=384 RepID=UPI001037C3EE|nr:hypothetical protein [Rhizobium leguminosarum]TBG89592.1 hypothetical protein ELG67_11075 [Rhizobium leguminosarum]
MNQIVAAFNHSEVVYPSDRIREFVRLARTEINTLIPNELWDLNLWEVGDYFITKGQNYDTRIVPFYNVDAVLSSTQQITGDPLRMPFRDFAKAYVRYRHSASPGRFETTMNRLHGVRFIEAGFIKLGIDPAIENLNVAVLNEAVQIAGVGVADSRWHNFASYIQQAYRFCMEHKFLNAPFHWKHGVRKPLDRIDALGEEAKKWRDKRLPSPEAFYALAHIFRNAERFVDKLYSAVCAICISVPIRAHEVLQLRLDCEVFATNETPDGDLPAYGIRVWPGKGHPPQVKWVPTQMVSLVQEAVARLREMCAPARAVAEWYEANPTSLWLPENLSHLRDQEWMPKAELGTLLNLAGNTGYNQFIRHNKLRYRSERPKPGLIDAVNFADLSNHLISRLPKRFPFFNGDPEQLYSRTLIVLSRNQGHGLKPDYTCLVEMATVQSFANWLAGHDNGAMPSIFKIWGFTERDGSEIEITTHAFRHWLNTVAQLKGMSDLDIAKWSGRDIDQNKAYNHVTPEETLAQFRQLADEGATAGPMFEAARMQGVNSPVSIKEFNQAQIGSALLNDYGYCVHDYSLLPCQIHGDCLGCSENVFVKGDQEHRQNIGIKLSLIERQLADALAAMDDGFYGADRWVDSHRRSIQRMQEMLAVHDDPNIPDGTLVNLKEATIDNAVAMALRDRELGDAASSKPTEDCDFDEALIAELMEVD